MASRRSSLVPLKRTLRRIFGLEKLVRQTRAARYAPKGEPAPFDREKLERMVNYGQTTRCRWALLHAYFDAPDEQPEGGCGHCDNCLHPLSERLREQGLHRTSFGDAITRRFRAEFVGHSPASEQGAA